MFAQALSVSVKRIVDGDTVSLQDGRQLRLIGVNTPELFHGVAPDQPLAKEARQYLQSLLRGFSSIKLVPGEQAVDRYGRQLGYVYLPNGDSVEARLLAQGLGFHIAIPPNVQQLDCLQRAETLARTKKLGVWQDPYYKPLHADGDINESGFLRVQGVVEKVQLGQGDWWIELKGRVVLRIPVSAQPYFTAYPISSLLSREIVVRGWLIDRRARQALLKRGFKPWLMVLKHPSAIEFDTGPERL